MFAVQFFFFSSMVASLDGLLPFWFTYPLAK